VPNIESRCNQLKLGHPRRTYPRWVNSWLVALPDNWILGDFTWTVTALIRTSLGHWQNVDALLLELEKWLPNDRWMVCF
jgi:hypothetical protein